MWNDLNHSFAHGRGSIPVSRYEVRSEKESIDDVLKKCIPVACASNLWREGAATPGTAEGTARSYMKNSEASVHFKARIKHSGAGLQYSDRKNLKGR